MESLSNFTVDNIQLASQRFVL